MAWAGLRRAGFEEVEDAQESGSVTAQDGTDVHVSTDGGRSFEARSLWPANRAGSFIRDLAVAPGSDGARIAVATLRYFDDQPTLWHTTDAGRTWNALVVDLPGFAGGSQAVAVTPTGRMFAAGVLHGIACSADGGRTWGTTCPSPDVG